MVELDVSPTGGEWWKLVVLSGVSNSPPRLEMFGIFGPHGRLYGVFVLLFLLDVWPHDSSEPLYRLLRRLVAEVGELSVVLELSVFNR
ncbi:hypothetical protein [Natronomonas gomsonensis]|uniref:hypothetical protein n=1 Tax=Natronomonas gomsonensis TaxID=1046043 RepID=UPI0015BF75F4|nr:hypothetical protein [Natronomonas gomsonensis]